MPDPANNPGNSPPPLSGAELALAMVHQLEVLNATLMQRTAVEGSQLKLMDELCGRLEVLTRACEIIVDKLDEGKIPSKVGIADFAMAMVEADEEIMGGDEEEEEDPPPRR